MKSLSPFFLLLSLAFAFGSCQKEYSFEGNGVVVTPVETDLLISAEVEDAVSKLTARYEYNGTGRILKNLSNFNAGAVTGDLKIEATRDGTGRLSGARLVVVSTFNPAGDTANYQLHRNGTGRVIGMTIKPNVTSGPIIYDSVAYSYNASGKLASYIFFSVSRIGTTISAEPYQRFELTYSGENVTKRLEYLLTGSVNNAELLETINIQYDARPATRVLTEEEYMLELAPVNGFVPAVNNIVRLESVSATEPDDNYVSVYAYIYGTNNKPSSAQVTTTYADGGKAISNMKFVYN